MASGVASLLGGEIVGKAQHFCTLDGVAVNNLGINQIFYLILFLESFHFKIPSFTLSRISDDQFGGA